MVDRTICNTTIVRDSPFSVVTFRFIITTFSTLNSGAFYIKRNAQTRL